MGYSNLSLMETCRTEVVARLRPPLNQQISVECVSDSKLICAVPDSDDTNAFHFDHVLSSGATQSDVYSLVQPVVLGVLDGINGTVLAYGQTGSGKTHTLFGSLDDATEWGIVPRAAQDLMESLWQRSDSTGVFVTVSAAEIYCERIYDLLEPSNSDLQIKQDSVNGVYIAGLVEMTVANAMELHQTMQRGMAHRTVSSTGMNAMSSRSHCIVNIQFKHIKSLPVPFGKLCMVDLAGSERQAKTGTSGVQLDEGILINKSLSALANVIASLSESKSRHIPYRESKLTRVLQDSLGGNAKTVLIVCCSPDRSDLGETLCSLRFGSRARGITNTIERGRSVSLEQQLQDSQEECRRLRQELELRQMPQQTVANSKRMGFFRTWFLLFWLHFLTMLAFFYLEDLWLSLEQRDTRPQLKG